MFEITPEYVITAADDTFIKVYDLSGENKQHLKDKEGGVWAWKYDLENKILITAEHRSIRIWDWVPYLCFSQRPHFNCKMFELSSNENGKFILSRDSKYYGFEIAF